MRTSVIILILFYSIKICGQERLFFQSDSIYKLNKIEEIKLFNGNRLTATVFFDTNGRTIKYQGAPVTSGWQKSEFFEYDKNGKLINQFDIIQDKGEKLLKFEIEYSNDEIIKLTQRNPNGSLNLIKHYENNGRKEIWESYKKGKIYSYRIIEYLDDLNVQKSYGWWISRGSEKKKFNTSFEYKYENGMIRQYTRYDNGVKALTSKIEYYNNNLIKNIKYNGITAKYKYKHYK